MPTSWRCCCAGHSSDIQREDGGSVYFRLSTRPVEQPERTLDAGARGGDRRRRLLAARAGARRRAGDRLLRRGGARGDRRARGDRARTCPAPACSASPRPTGCTATGGRRWRRGEVSVAERLLARLRPGAALVTVVDGHPATLSWLGAVRGNRVVPLGVDRFGQSGDIPDLYRVYGLDCDAILDAAARACLRALARRGKAP